MSKNAFEKIKAGLEDAIAYAEGDASRGIAHQAIDVAAIRKKLGLSQAQFADRYGLDKASVQQWEQGRRRPERSARVLLRVIEQNPEAVETAARSA